MEFVLLLFSLLLNKCLWVLVKTVQVIQLYGKFEKVELLTFKNWEYSIHIFFLIYPKGMAWDPLPLGNRHQELSGMLFGHCRACLHPGPHHSLLSTPTYPVYSISVVSFKHRSLQTHSWEVLIRLEEGTSRKQWICKKLCIETISKAKPQSPPFL